MFVWCEMLFGCLCVDVVMLFMLYVIVLFVCGYCECFLKVELELNSNEGIIDLLEWCIDVVIWIGWLKDLMLYSWWIGNSWVCMFVSFVYFEVYG